MKKLIKSTYLLVFIYFSCSTNKNIHSKNDFILTKSDISHVINLVENNENTYIKNNYNYHFQYVSMYNDSTFNVSLYYNQQLPDTQSNISNFVKNDDNYIFIYNPNYKINKSDLTYLSENKLISYNKNNSPFFMLHSRYWNLIIEKRKKGIIVKKTYPLLKKDIGNDKDISTDF